MVNGRFVMLLFIMTNERSPDYRDNSVTLRGRFYGAELFPLPPDSAVQSMYRSFGVELPPGLIPAFPKSWEDNRVSLVYFKSGRYKTDSFEVPLIAEIDGKISFVDSRSANIIAPTAENLLNGQRWGVVVTRNQGSVNLVRIAFSPADVTRRVEVDQTREWLYLDTLTAKAVQFAGLCAQNNIGVAKIVRGERSDVVPEGLAQVIFDDGVTVFVNQKETCEQLLATRQTTIAIQKLEVKYNCLESPIDESSRLGWREFRFKVGMAGGGTWNCHLSAPADTDANHLVEYLLQKSKLTHSAEVSWDFLESQELPLGDSRIVGEVDKDYVLSQTGPNFIEKDFIDSWLQATPANRGQMVKELLTRSRSFWLAKQFHRESTEKSNQQRKYTTELQSAGSARARQEAENDRLQKAQQRKDVDKKLVKDSMGTVDGLTEDEIRSLASDIRNGK